MNRFSNNFLIQAAVMIAKGALNYITHQPQHVTFSMTCTCVLFHPDYEQYISSCVSEPVCKASVGVMFMCHCVFYSPVYFLDVFA